MQGQFNPMTGQMGEPWPILSQIEQLFTVRTLTADIDHIDKDVDVLMLVHPKQLPQKTLYAIDQFVMRGGKMLLFVDPDSGADTSGQDPSNPFAGAMAESFLESRTAALGMGRQLRSEQGDRRSRARARGALQHASAADAPHRHSRLAPRRHGSEGRRHRLARCDQCRHRRLPVGAPRRQDHVRAAAAKLQGRRADSRRALQCDERSREPARWIQADGRSLCAGGPPDRDPWTSAFPQGAPPDQKPSAGPPIAHLSKSVDAGQHRRSSPTPTC